MSTVYFAVANTFTNSAIDGFFDAGMLLQALKARGEGPDIKPSERAGVNAKRREIGKRLRLSEN